MKRLFIFILVLIMQVIFISCGNKSSVIPEEINLSVDLISPIQGEEVNQDNIVLQWQINDFRSHSSIVYLGTEIDNITAIETTDNNNYTINILPEESVFYWKIQVPLEETNQMVTSQIQSFTTKETEGPIIIVRYEDLIEELDQIEEGLETISINTLEQSLTNILNNINHQDTEITNEQKDYIKYRYNYNYGWLTLRKFNKSLTQNQIDYFIDQIDYDSTYHDNYVGLVYQIMNDLSLDFTEYEYYLDNQINYIRQGFKYKKFGDTYFDYRMYVNYLQILYSQLGKNDRINQLEHYTNDEQVYQQIYEFMYGGYPE